MLSNTNINTCCTYTYAGDSLNTLKRDVLLEIKKIITNKKFLIKNELKTTNVALINHVLTSSFEETFKQLLISTAISAELFSANIIQEIFEIYFNPNKANIISEINNQLQSGGKKPTIDDLNWLFKKYLNENQIQLLQSAINCVGFGGKIHVTKTFNSVLPIVKQHIGYNFDFQIMDLFQDKKFLEPRVLIYDGYVESVGEIHNILEKSFESKECLVFFHRGLHNDVLNTIIQNWNRGTLRVLPIQVQYDLDGINSLNDLAIITNSEIICSLKGQLLSGVKYSELKVIDEFITQKKQIAIINKNTITNVLAHQKFLYQKRSEVHDDVTELYDKRIRSLSQGLVTIYLPDSQNFFLEKQQIDIFLRSYKSLLDFGTINVNNQQMLTSTAIAIIKFMPILEKNIQELGAMIIQ